MKSYITTGTLATRMPSPNNQDPPEIGSTLRFVPTALTIMNMGQMVNYGIDVNAISVTGVCVYVNAKHHFARYRYETAKGAVGFECFKY